MAFSRPNGGFISAFFDPLKTPNAPTIGTATVASATSVSVSFTAPTNVGSSAITGYIATAQDSSGNAIGATGSASPITITGLTTGVTYTVKVLAVNAYGQGPYSAASNSVVPIIYSFISDVYPGNGVSVATDSSNNVYTLGANYQDGFKILAKFNAAGTLQWKKQISGTTGNLSVAVDSSDNVIVQFQSSSTWNIMKLTSAGAITWQKEIFGFSSLGNMSGAWVTTDSSGNIYTSAQIFTTSYRLAIFKLDSSGNIVWQNQLSSGYDFDLHTGITVDSSGNVYTVAQYNISAIGNYGGILVKYDSAGTLQWQRTIYISGGASSFTAVTCDTSGNVYVTGRYGTTSARMLTAKYDSSGNLQWGKVLYTGDVQYSYGIDIDSSSNVYITGYNVFTYVRYMAKYDSSGVLQWQRQLTSGSSRRSYDGSVAVDSTGTPTFIGYSTDSGAANPRFQILKVPADGTKTGTYTVSGTTWTYTTLAATDASISGTYGTSGGSSSALGCGTRNISETVTDASSTNTGTTTL